MSEDRTLNEADLEGFARRVWDYARQDAEIKDKAAVYCGHLFKDSVIREALSMLKAVVLHERMQAGRPAPDWCDSAAPPLPVTRRETT